MSDVEFTDRYQALGIPYPDPATCCDGQCEGTGVVPVQQDNQEVTWSALWKAAHKEAGEHECDGTHFVRCPSCAGTGKKAGLGSPP